MFLFFSESDLSRIKSSAAPLEILQLKELKVVTRCFKRLFQKFDLNQLVLKKIIANIFSEDLVPKVQMAYVIAVCVIILNLKCEKIKLDKKEMQDKVVVFW